jgi:hypothetical protein
MAQSDLGGSDCLKPAARRRRITADDGKIYRLEEDF